MKRVLQFIFFVQLIVFISGCSENQYNKPKYVFYFIGDGMGIQQVNAAQLFIDSVLRDTNNLSFSNFPVQGFVTTYAADRYITCSAAAGTALSTGSKTSIGTLGLDASRKDSLFSIAKKFKENGCKVGIVTSVSIDHATPAAFYAHQPERGGYYPIALDLIRSKYDFFASGGLKDPYGKREKSEVKSIYEIGKANSIAFTTNDDSLKMLRDNYKTVVFSAPNPSQGNALQFNIDATENDFSLAKLTSIAVDMLDNPKGFFIMVEGGKIDWACHSNDGVTAIKEVISFSQAIKIAVDFYNAHPDETLIIVTADHETGGMSIGNQENSYNVNLKYLGKQIISKERLELTIDSLRARNPKPGYEEIFRFIQVNTGLGTPDLPLNEKEISSLKNAYLITFGIKKSVAKVADNEYSEKEDLLADVIINLINTKAGIGWTSTSHTGSPVPLFVLGQGQNQFRGGIDNTDIPKLISKIAF